MKKELNDFECSRTINIDFNLPVTLQFFDKQGMPKVILLTKKHIEYLMCREYSDITQDFINKLCKKSEELGL